MTPKQDQKLKMTRENDRLSSPSIIAFIIFIENNIKTVPVIHHVSIPLKHCVLSPIFNKGVFLDSLRMSADDEDFLKAQRAIAGRLLHQLAKTGNGAAYSSIPNVESILAEYLWCEKCSDLQSLHVCEDCLSFAMEELAVLLPKTKRIKKETGSEMFHRMKEESKARAVKKAKRDVRKMVLKKEIKPITAYFSKKKY